MVAQSTRFIEVPPEVRTIAVTLNSAGERAYLVGGALRDILLGKEAVDFDIATTATPHTVLKLFARVVPTGIAHGTVTIILNKKQFETTTLRKEAAYSDKRHPDRVDFLEDIEADLARRDFTVNAMAWDPLREQFFDPFGGEEDLKKGNLRAVGDAAARFAEDGLRSLRAARFAATLAFKIDGNTRSAMPASASALEQVSRERKRDELVKLLKAPRPSSGLAILEQTSLLSPICAELALLASTPSQEMSDLLAWPRSLTRVDRLPPRLHLRLAGLLADAGRILKPDFQPLDSAKVARKILEHLRFSRKTIDAVWNLVRLSGFAGYAKWDDAQIRRFICRAKRNRAQELVELRRADAAATEDPESEEMKAIDRLADRVREISSSDAPLSIAELAVNGGNLLRHFELKPGPHIGEMLEMLLEHVLEYPEHNTEEHLLKVAQNLLSPSPL